MMTRESQFKILNDLLTKNGAIAESTKYSVGQMIFDEKTRHARFKNVNNCMNRNIYSHIETSGLNSINILWVFFHESALIFYEHS